MNSEFDIVAPRADALMESLRATGYSLPDAVSDLIDNSITAQARNIWINFNWAGEDSWASILDDGHGMCEEELIDAMRIGSRSPDEARDPSDLGRYGLGLKTASISQARSLTVATQFGERNAIAARRWDLDHLQLTGDWQLLKVSLEEVGIGIEQLSQLAHGTLVVWNRMDGLVGDVRSNETRERGQFLNAIRAVEEHVGMVFHRFMTRRNSIKVWINGNIVKPWDPFLTDESATQRLSSETVGPSHAEITVSPYVLPHHSHLTQDRHRVAGGPRGWNAHQGFYVYRNRRLLLPGDWLGLGFVKEEHYKLARIQVDLPNSLDQQWSIDVRKSYARPPVAHKDDLRRIAQATRKRAVTVYRHRGKVIARGARKSPMFVWQRRVKAKRVTYVVNRGHPLIRHTLAMDSIVAQDLDRILRLVEEYVPVRQIWIDMAKGDEDQSIPFESAAEREIVELIRALYTALINAGYVHDEAMARLKTTEAIGDRYELVEPTVEILLKDKSDG